MRMICSKMKFKPNEQVRKNVFFLLSFRGTYKVVPLTALHRSNEHYHTFEMTKIPQKL